MKKKTVKNHYLITGISFSVIAFLICALCTYIDASLFAEGQKKKYEGMVSLLELREMQKPIDEVVFIPAEPAVTRFSIADGMYTVTAYCGCEKCCGKYSSELVLDEFGIPIVTGAEGTRLISGVSAAAPLPFGTRVYLEGYGEVVIQDRTAGFIVERYEGKIIDIYFDYHDQALQFGKRHLQAFILKEEI